MINCNCDYSAYIFSGAYVMPIKTYLKMKLMLISFVVINFV